MAIESGNIRSNSLEEHWMPFTSNRDYKENPRLMVEADGVYYTDHHGKKLIDASSGLFCSPAGHGRSEIRDAVYAAGVIDTPTLTGTWKDELSSTGHGIAKSMEAAGFADDDVVIQGGSAKKSN